MRRWTGLVLRAALLLIGAAMLGRGLPAGVWRWVTPQHLLETAFRIETGAVRAPAETAAPEIFLAEPTPAMTPEPTSASDAPDRTPDGLPILPTSLTFKRATWLRLIRGLFTVAIGRSLLSLYMKTSISLPTRVPSGTCLMGRRIRSAPASLSSAKYAP